MIVLVKISRKDYSFIFKMTGQAGHAALTFDKRPYSLAHATDRVFVVSNGTMRLFRKTNLDPISRATL